MPGCGVTVSNNCGNDKTSFQFNVAFDAVAASHSANKLPQADKMVVLSNSEMVTDRFVLSLENI